MMLTLNNIILVWCIGVGIAALYVITWKRDMLSVSSKVSWALIILVLLWPFTIIAYIVYVFREKFKERESKTHTIKPCKDRIFYGIECLENETQLGFFKSEADRRPSSCVWIDKDVATKLFKLFKYGKDGQELMK